MLHWRRIRSFQTNRFSLPNCPPRFRHFYSHPKNPDPSKMASFRGPKHPCYIQVRSPLPLEGRRFLKAGWLVQDTSNLQQPKNLRHGFFWLNLIFKLDSNLHTQNQFSTKSSNMFWGLPHLANGPWNKSSNFIFPTKHVIPKSSKFGHWPSKFLFWCLKEIHHVITYLITNNWIYMDHSNAKKTLPFSKQILTTVYTSSFWASG